MRHLQNFHSESQNAKIARRPEAGDVEALKPAVVAGIPGTDAKLTPPYSCQTNYPARLLFSATPSDLAKLKDVAQERKKRARHFGADLFADPAWDILISLAIAEIEQKRVTISELCLAATVPSTTALRWISKMAKDGFLTRRPDVFDRRKVYIEFSTPCSANMKSYLTDIQS